MATESLVEKKIGYGFREDNFTVDGELMVTITLHEYRDLVKNDATRSSQIDIADEKERSTRYENEKLKKENDALKAELYELKKKLDEISSVKECLPDEGRRRR